MVVMKNIGLFVLYLFATCSAFPKSIDSASEELNGNNIDQLIENEITEKLTNDVLDSVAAKFRKDLEKGVASVLSKVNKLISNGTNQIEKKFDILQDLMDDMFFQNYTNASCSQEYEKLNDAVTKQPLHQMVLCGYTLIGYEAEAPLIKVNQIKDYIIHQILPLNETVVDLRGIVKDCGHKEYEFSGVIRCVIQKSHAMKTMMIEVSQRLTEEISEFAKPVAHGAMHEACLIEVLSSVEDQALRLAEELRTCLQKSSLEPQNWTPETVVTPEGNWNVSKSIISEFDLETVFKEYNKSKQFMKNTDDVAELLSHVWPDKMLPGLPAAYNETNIENFLYKIKK